MWAELIPHQTDLQTLEIRQIVESGIKIFDFDYPNLKIPTFESDFIRHFYFRQIGVETIARWKIMLQDKLNLIAPYYNELIDSTKIDFDYLSDYEMTTTKSAEGEKSGSTSNNVQSDTTNTGTTTNKSKSTNDYTHGQKVDTTNNSTSSDTTITKQSDTPMSKVSNITNGYLTNVNDSAGSNTTTGTNSVINSGTDKSVTNLDDTVTSTSTNSNTATATGTNTDKTKTSETSTTKGNTKSKLALIKEYRELLLKVEQQIFEDMSDLFLLIY